MSVLPVLPVTLLLYAGSAVLAFVLAAALTPLVGRIAERWPSTSPTADRATGWSGDRARVRRHDPGLLAR